jgi:hypothetical protein
MAKVGSRRRSANQLLPSECTRSVNVGLSPKNVGLHPKNVGVSPRNVGLHPRNVGVSPRNVGVSPRNVGLHPRNVGVSPRNVGLCPRSVGVSPRNVGLYPRNVGLCPRRVGVCPRVDGANPTRPSRRAGHGRPTSSGVKAAVCPGRGSPNVGGGKRGTSAATGISVTISPPRQGRQTFGAHSAALPGREVGRRHVSGGGARPRIYTPQEFMEG